MTKEIKTNELEKRELALDNIEEASGGCIFYHNMDLLDLVKTPDGTIYKANKCIDCGEESFWKNDEEIFPSEFYTTKINNPIPKTTISIIK